jgi:hypothetical protein
MDGQHPTDPSRNKPDEFQEASRATAQEEYDDYAKHSYAYTAPKRTTRKVLLALVAIVLLAAAAFALYEFVLKKDDITKTDTSKSSDSSRQEQAADSDTLITEQTEHYASTGFMLEFDYPNDWKVSEPTGEGRLTVTSPAVSLTQADGQKFTGQIVMSIRNKQQALPEFDKGNATAAMASEKINYAKPSSVQRGSTYLSFLTYAGTTQSDRLDGLYITGDVGYQKGQAIPKADFTPVDPVISVTFVKCSDASCGSEGAAAGVDTKMWQDSGFGTPLKSMLQSLTIN